LKREKGNRGVNMRRCKICVMPDTRPELTFDKHGVCDACRSAEKKEKAINWNIRKKEFEELLARYRSKDGKNYDCIIPVSGGKDSTYQVYMMKKVFGMNPLCVTFSPCKSTDIGKKNLQCMRDLGVDSILFTPNPVVYKKLFKIGFERLGDPCWPCHVGIFTYPVTVAVKYNVPLLVWGENPQMEYGGPASIREHPYLDKHWLQQFGGMLGNRVEDMVGDDITAKDLVPYTYPSDEEIHRVGVTGLFLGYYFKWDARKQLEVIKKEGFNVREKRSIGTYTNYENLDCGFVDIHDHLKYLKYGFGRCTDQACIDIRNGRLTRVEAMEMVKKYDHEVEKVKEFCEFIGITEEEFWKIANSFKGNWVREEHIVGANKSLKSE
jgi:N-acetyl sugar amidotransferase